MRKERNKLTIFVFSFYLLLLIWVIVFKLAFSIDEIPRMRIINLIPFAQSYLLNGRFNYSEIVLNVLAFIPLGIYLKILQPELSWRQQIIICFSLSFVFELAQFIFGIGVSDITDLLSNTSGGIIGLLLYQTLHKLWAKNTVKIVNILGLIIELLALSFWLFLVMVNQ